MKPGDVLYENYLFPMRWKVHEFASHIGVKVSRLDHLKQGSVIIDFDLALRISEALGMYGSNVLVEASTSLFN